MTAIKKPSELDLGAIRKRLSESNGHRYWRSLEEIAQTEDFQEFLRREFRHQIPDYRGDEVGRRKFLQLMAASLALAGLNACTNQPTEEIVPYVIPPERLIPGKPLFFASALSVRGMAQGVIVENHMGRPTKIEGNPDHPASLGAADPLTQASILTLYDPDRAQVVTQNGRISTWESFTNAIRLALGNLEQSGGQGFRILTETVTSPTLAAQIRDLLSRYPSAQWHQYEPASGDLVRQGLRQVLGQERDAVYSFDRADVVFSLDSDFLNSPPSGVRYTKDFSRRRRVTAGKSDMNRLYMVESSVSVTGSMADHRLAVKPSQVRQVAQALAGRLGVAGAAALPTDLIPQNWIAALARDLQNHRGSSIVIAGETQPADVHALVHRINEALGNIGRTLRYIEAVEANPVVQMESLQRLAQDMDQGLVDTLVMLSGNPVYTAPADLSFAQKMEKVGLRIHLSLFFDETSALCHWHIPETHYLETWSDARAFDGTVSIIQPLIAPLYAGRSVHEFLASFTEQAGSSSYDLVRSYWESQSPAADFEKFWRKALHDGVIEAGVRSPEAGASEELQPPPSRLPPESEELRPPTSGLRPTFEILFRPDPHIFDGRFANNAWLQELPQPITKTCWGNAVFMSPATAERLELQNEDEVELRYQGRSVKGPVWILPGHANDCATINLGYGRTRAGSIGNGVGFNAYLIRTSDAPWIASGAEIVRTGEKIRLVTTQDHHSMEGRDLVRVGTLEQYKQNPEFAHEAEGEPAVHLSLLPEWEYPGHAWGMAIDLNTCIGCNACTIACQAENNIPVVGADEVALGREMHWIRVDSYYRGQLDFPEVYHQPVPCMHCEKAPCELVCPVYATVHSDEGLNDMIYNRCVGTRYCSNNCPYKVRRFNFLLYQDWTTPSLKLQRNPDVSIRSRGVMEKCTYCVQRIRHAEIEAKNEDRPIREGEIMTACQQTCPADAIIFGDVNDPTSHVAQLKAQHLNYGILTELNTQPRTTYLARLRNPNAELENAEHC